MGGGGFQVPSPDLPRCPPKKWMMEGQLTSAHGGASGSSGSGGDPCSIISIHITESGAERVASPGSCAGVSLPSRRTVRSGPCPPGPAHTPPAPLAPALGQQYGQLHLLLLFSLPSVTPSWGGWIPRPPRARRVSVLLPRQWGESK